MITPVTLVHSLLLSLLTASMPLYAEQAIVAVATNFVKPLEAIQPIYEKSSGHKLVISGGSTGRLYAQIKHGAPYDVFLSADEIHPRLLEQEGLGVAGTRFTYAIGKLVLWSSNAELIHVGPAVLKNGNVRTLALANPELAPYGLAAKQTLEHLQLWKVMQNNIVLGENIGQTFSMIQTGNAELGFIALSQILEMQGGDKGSRWEVPAGMHTPIVQQAILLSRGSNNPAALTFVRFLSEEVAQKIITESGYVLE